MRTTRLAVLLLCLSLSAGPVLAASETLSGGSALSAQGSAMIVTGSLDVLTAGASVVVESVTVAGESVVVVVDGLSEAGKLTLRLSGAALGGASLAVGATLEVVSMSTGYLLVSAGEVLAFLPNEAGRTLLHHSTHTGF